MTEYKIPSIEEFRSVLAGLMYGKQPHEGVRSVILFTLYTKEQIDAVVNLFGGWKIFAEAMEDRFVQLSITHDDSDTYTALSNYITANLQIVKSNVRVASFKPLNE